MFGIGWNNSTTLTQPDDAVLQFVENSLGVSLDQVQFGSSLDDYDLEKADPYPALAPGLMWYQTPGSGGETVLASAKLAFGFKAERLVAVRLRLLDLQDEGRSYRDYLRAEFQRVAGRNRFTIESERFSVCYHGYCNPQENIFAIITITERERRG